MQITDRHIALLRASHSLANGGPDTAQNPQDAEECIDLGLVEPGPGYPLTDKGRAVLA